MSEKIHFAAEPELIESCSPNQEFTSCAVDGLGVLYRAVDLDEASGELR
ncbi:MAG TPA: hypothetical protein VMU05_19745 [Dongiaceae bacterium]|nr:hypothetical protein [Dongiaceae bacterium]